MAGIPFLHNIDLKDNQLLNAKLHTSISSSPPSGGGLGQGAIWYDSTNDLVKTYDGSNWNTISGDITGVTSSTTNQLIVTNSGGPAPAFSIVTAAIADGGTGLATADQIHTFVTSGVVDPVQIDGNFTIGVDDTGYDVKFFGATSGQYMLWDQSADKLIVTGEIEAGSLDISGDVDVDGTSNLDNTDIDGTLAVDGTTISLDATTSLNIDNSNTSNGITIGTVTSGVPITIGHTTSETTIQDNLTVTGTIESGNITIANASPIIQLTDTDTNADCRIHADSSNGSFAIDADFNNESTPTKIHLKCDGKEVGYFRGNNDYKGSLRLFPEKNDDAAQGIFFGTSAEDSSPGAGAFTDIRVMSMSSTNQLFLMPDSNTTLATVPMGITSSAITTNVDTINFNSSNSTDPLVIIKNTTNDANGARLHFVKDKGAAGADGDDIGIIEFIGDDAAQTQTSFAKVIAEVGEADNTDEAGKLSIQVAASDGTTTGLENGLVLTGHKTGDYVDVTLGTGTSSTTTIAGNLTVSGTTTTVESTTLTVTDDLITVSKGNDTIANADGSGVEIDATGGTNIYWKYVHANTAWTSNVDIDVTSGNVYNIAGTEVLGGTTLGSTIVTSSLTSVGTIGTGVWQGTEVGLGYGGTELVGETDGKIVVADGSGAPVHLDIGSSSGITILGTIATGVWNGTSIGTAYTDAKVTSIIAGDGIDVSGATGDVTVTAETATTSNAGSVELATCDEVKTGTDTSRAVTPDALACRSVAVQIDKDATNFSANKYAEITHSLDTEDIIVQLFDAVTKATVYADVARTDKAGSASTSKVKVSFAAVPTNDVDVIITSAKGASSGAIAYN